MIRIILLLSLFFAAAGCESDGYFSGNFPPDDVSTSEGQIIFTGMVEADGCGWNFETSDGELYHPVSIPESFKKDSLPVLVLFEQKGEDFLCGFGGRIPEIEIFAMEKN